MRFGNHRPFYGGEDVNVEYRVDEVGDYIWVVTAWKSTKQERKSYEETVN